jgi:hypothetical protein
MPNCCCLNVLNLCNVPVCGILELNAVATDPESPASNDYSLVLDFLGQTVTIIQEQTEGDNIKFDVSMLNENYQYTGQVFDPSGEIVNIEDSPNSYDCIRFKTVLNVASY